MRITIKAKGLKLTESIEAFVNEKIGSLEKFVKSCHKDDEWEDVRPACEFLVEIEKESRHHKKGPFFRAEVNIKLSGRLLRAEAKNDDLMLAIVEVKDEMQQEMKKYKLKAMEVGRKRQRKFKDITRAV